MTEFAIRTARLADAGPIARLDVETWQATYAGILGTPYLAGLSPARRELGWNHVITRDPQGVHVALNGDGEVIGFGTCGAARGVSDFTSEVFTLYVAPDWQNQGFGRRLLLAMFAKLVAQNHTSTFLWVLRENPSRFFYQRLGGKEVCHKMLPFNGTTVAAAAYGWFDLPGFLATHPSTERGSEG